LPAAVYIGNVIFCGNKNSGENMAKGEIVPHGNNAELVIKNNTTYASYDGVVFFQEADGAVGIGTNLDEKTLKVARRGETTEDELKSDRRLWWGIAGVNAAIVGGLTARGFAVGEAGAAIDYTIGSFNIAVAGLGSRITPRRAKKRHAAIVAMADRLTQIPSSDIYVDIQGLSDRTAVDSRVMDTPDLITILQKMQTSHLSQEAASEFEAKHKATINPAMVVKGGLLGLDSANRSSYLHRVFDNTQELSRLTHTLKNHAALSETKSGQEGLRLHTGALLGRLGEVASTFIDLKAAETVPSVQNLMDVADDTHFLAGLQEAHTLLTQPDLSLERYDLATRYWGEAGTL
jgi:hypothetical protein